MMNTGGKGANQAVAAARLSASVVFIAKVGNDLFGKTGYGRLQERGHRHRFRDGRHHQGLRYGAHHAQYQR